MIIFHHKLTQVELSRINYHTKQPYTETWENLVLKSKYFNFKIKLPQFQREMLNFFRNSTMQRNEKKQTNKQTNKNTWDKIKRIAVLIKESYHYVCKKTNYFHKKCKDLQFYKLRVKTDRWYNLPWRKYLKVTSVLS